MDPLSFEKLTDNWENLVISVIHTFFIKVNLLTWLYSSRTTPQKFVWGRAWKGTEYEKVHQRKPVFPVFPQFPRKHIVFSNYWIIVYICFILFMTWDKVFKNGPSKIFQRLFYRNFTWSILEYSVPFIEFWSFLVRYQKSIEQFTVWDLLFWI